MNRSRTLYQPRRRSTLLLIQLGLIIAGVNHSTAQAISSQAREVSSEPRCWIGVIDQINPPWVMVVGERGEEVSLPLDRAYQGAREGDWVVYWRHAQRVEKLRSKLARHVSRELDKLTHHLARSPGEDEVTLSPLHLR